MPVKNYHPRFLQQALESLFAQTSPNWRLLVILEPQADAALKALLSGLQDQPRTRVIINQGRGLAGAFNTGMRAAETEFVAILLSDDLWTPTAIEVLASRIHACPEVDLHHTALRVVDDAGGPISSVRHPPERVSLTDFVRGSPVKHLLCWRRAKALSFGGMDESLNNVGPDDYDFPWTMLEHGAVIRSLDECLYKYRDHRESYRLTTHLPVSVHVRELRRILQKHRVPAELAGWRIRTARQSFLRQCLYRNELDRWLREKIIAADPRKGWREPLIWSTQTHRGSSDQISGRARDASY